jgi:hypothetical protein
MKIRDRILLVIPFLVLAVVVLFEDDKRVNPEQSLVLGREIQEVGIYDSLFMNDMEIIPDFTMVSADFTKFYERFNTDESFQRKHLAFPLKGVCFSNCDSTSLWSEPNWHHLKWDFRSMAENPMYDVVMAQSDSKFFFKCEIHDMGILYELGFVKSSGKWKLVYCVLNAC